MRVRNSNYVFKSLNGLSPDYLKSVYTDRSVISTYSLRNCWGKLAVRLPSNNFLKNSFSYICVAVLWNSVSTDLRQAAQLSLAAGVSFLKMNKLYLITHHS